MEDCAVKTIWRLTPVGRAAAIFVVALLLIEGITAEGARLFWVPVLVLLILSPFISWINIRKVRPQALQPEMAFAWDLLHLPIVLTNDSRRFTARDIVLAHGVTTRSYIRSCGFVSTIGPQAQQRLDCPYRIPHRGHFRSHALTLTSSFPFGLFSWTKSFDMRADFLGLPRLGSLKSLDHLLETPRMRNWQSRLQSQGEDEFEALRLWRPGMSQRRVHWKSSARQGRILLKEMVGEGRPVVHIVLDKRVPAYSSQSRRMPAFENAVSLTGTLVEYFVRRGYQVRCTLSGFKSKTYGRRGQRSHFLAILRELALIKPEAHDTEENGATGWRPRNGEITFLVKTGDVRKQRIPSFVRQRKLSQADGPVNENGLVVLDMNQESTWQIFTHMRYATRIHFGQVA